jgi:hypothetical protein
MSYTQGKVCGLSFQGALPNGHHTPPFFEKHIYGFSIRGVAEISSRRRTSDKCAACGPARGYPGSTRRGGWTAGKSALDRRHVSRHRSQERSCLPDAPVGWPSLPVGAVRRTSLTRPETVPSRQIREVR